MKILYVGMKYDYMNPARGYSFEHYNFYDALVHMDGGIHEVAYFPFDEIMQRHGREEMNRMLSETVQRINPDLCFFFLFNDEITSNTIRKITEAGYKTFNWFADDHWRFENFSKYWCWNFNYVSTTDSMAVDKYQKIGYQNVIKTQWACNHFLYRPPKIEERGRYFYDVSFVGQFSDSRKKIIEGLAQQGMRVSCFGSKWPSGKVSQEKMIEVFHTSRINLNIATPEINFFREIAKVFTVRKQGQLHLALPKEIQDNYRSFLGKSRRQIKGRVFEIPGCNGLLFTENADNLAEYYHIGKELIVYNDTQDLAGKIDYYLKRPAEMETIATAGYARTLREHTYEIRFREIFNIISSTHAIS